MHILSRFTQIRQLREKLIASEEQAQIASQDHAHVKRVLEQKVSDLEHGIDRLTTDLEQAEHRANHFRSESERVRCSNNHLLIPLLS